MENVCSLFFEISNEDRMRILQEIDQAPLKLTNISRKLDLTSSETHRQLSRLSEAKLVKKDVEGFFCLTPFGRQVLFWIPGYKFMADNREFFQNHTLSGIHPNFLSRLGDLSISDFSDDALVTVSHIETMITEAEEYIQNIHDQFLLNAYPLASEAIQRGVTIRSIDPVTYNPPIQIKGEVSVEVIQIMSKALDDGKIINRQLENFDVFLWMSEKEVAILSFPKMEGKFDYHGFISKDENFHNWCNDLFKHYWSKAQPKNELSLAKPY